jgi:hypothetical protein
VTFVEVPTAAQSISSVTSGGDGLNLITVANTREDSMLFGSGSSSEPGRTRVFYNESGSIVEADIALNPYQKFSTDGTFDTYDLESVFTHEIGHMLGLDHSSVLGAVMQPRLTMNGTFNLSAFSGRNLSHDDIAGAGTLYGSSGPADAVATITGTLTLPGGAPAQGVNLWVESEIDGRVIESTITLPNGSYRLGLLAAGRYRLFASSLNGVMSLLDLESRRGPYGTALTSVTNINGADLGIVKVKAGQVETLNAQVSPADQTALFLSVVGLNDEASSVAVPLVAGNTYRLYVGAPRLLLEDSSFDEIKISSPFIHVDQSLFQQEPFGLTLDAVSFVATVDQKAPPGVYSIKLSLKGRPVGFLVGAIVVNDKQLQEEILPIQSGKSTEAMNAQDSVRSYIISAGTVSSRSFHNSERLSVVTLG